MNAIFSDHATAARQHVCRRLWERFGIAMSHAEVKQIERHIVDGRAKWVLDQSRPGKRQQKSVYEVTIERADRKVTMYAVFSISLWALVTVLPCVKWVGRKKPCLKNLKKSQRR